MPSKDEDREALQCACVEGRPVPYSCYEARETGVPWKKWGPYLSERQWGTLEILIQKKAMKERVALKFSSLLAAVALILCIALPASAQETQKPRLVL